MEMTAAQDFERKKNKKKKQKKTKTREVMKQTGKLGK